MISANFSVLHLTAAVATTDLTRPLLMIILGAVTVWGRQGEAFGQGGVANG